MHMLMKPQVFYDDTHKQALGYRNLFNLKKAQRIKPTLYDGSVIAKEHDVISVIDDEVTLILEEESRSNMLNKQNDPFSIKQKINISPIDYSKLNKLKEDFGKHFVTKKELSVEQAVWLKHSNHTFDTSIKSHTPVRIEAPSELPKVSLVNESLKKLKYHLANFDKVVKKRTTSDAITAAAVDQCSVDKKDLEIQIKQLCIDNDKLLNQIMSQEIMHIAVNSVDFLDMPKLCLDECNKCLELETELLKKKDMIEKDVYDKLDNYGENQNAPTFNQLFKINELKAQSQEKDTVIRKLKDRIKSLSGKESVEKVKKDIDEIETINIELEHTLKNELRKLKGKNIVDTAVSTPIATTIALGMFKLDIEPISHRLKNNRDAHEHYLKKTIDNTNTLYGLVERTRKQNPGVKCSTGASGSKPSSNMKNNRISQPSCSNKTNKVEEQSRSVKSRKNKKNRADKTKCTAHVRQSMLNANFVSEPISNVLVKHSVKNAKFL
ncbi:hypothetical protein Tco_0937259 [Tanacetum coccineum]|uniref:Uncharacterized protein n=1 Tax=Tanacetum coccineum TaxID=301880 RepID=A0ABQ5DJX7_9ASTR